MSAWLVINSMRTERLQFDQLCGQNLANIWRTNAFEQVLNAHPKSTLLSPQARPNRTPITLSLHDDGTMMAA